MIEQIFNLRILCEKHKLQQKSYIIYLFISEKHLIECSKRHSMKKYNIDIKLIYLIQSLYENANSEVIYKGISGEWFPTKTELRQGCLLSPTLFNIFLLDIMNDALSIILVH